MYNRSESSRASIRSFLFPCLLFFRGSHTTSFVTCGFSRSYNQVAQVPSSKVTCNSPRSPSIKSRMTFAFVSITHSITSFPASFLTAIEMLSLCTSMPIYLVPVIKGCSFLEGLRQAPKPYSTRGALLYCVGLPVKLVLALDQPNLYSLVSKFGVKRQVRCRVDHLQLVGAAACSPGTSLWSAPIHDRAGIGSVPIRLPNRDRIEHDLLRSCGASLEIPSLSAYSLTTCQTTFSVISVPQTVPLRQTHRKILPWASCAIASQSSMVCFTQSGMGTVRMCPPFPTRSTIAQ